MGIQTHVEDLEPVSWALMTLAIILAGMRLAIRYIATRHLGFDDVLVAVALFLDIGATISLALAVNLGGLGRHKASLTPQQNEKRVEANYAQHILYIAVIATAKLSMTVFFRRLAVKQIHHRVTWALTGVIAAWAVSAELIVAFQCPMPHPWDPTAFPPGSCLPEKIWLYVTVVDCLTEALIMALPFWIIWNVRIPRRKKWLVQTLFAFRVVCVGPFLASITRYVASQTRPSAKAFDTSYDQTGYWLWTNLHSTIAIIAACIPALKPFLEWSTNRIGNMTGFQRSTGDTDSGNKYFNNTGSGSATFRLRAFSNSGASKLQPSTRATDSIAPAGFSIVTTTAGTGTPGYRAEARGMADSDSIDSEASVAMIIQQTKAWEVSYDGSGSPPATGTGCPDAMSHGRSTGSA